MRKSPINYVVTTATVAVLWVVAAIITGNYLGDNAALEEVTPEAFVMAFRLVMTIAAVVTIVACAHWFWYGSKSSTAADLAGARRFWSIWFFILVITSVACTAGVVVTFLTERFTVIEYLIMFGCASMLTWLPFWICSLFMSPRFVTNAPIGRR